MADGSRTWPPHIVVWPVPISPTGEETGEGKKPQPQPEPEPVFRPDPKPPIIYEPDDDDDTMIYRGGTQSDVNFTPALKDVGPVSDINSGLSFYNTPEKATGGKGGKYQMVSKKALEKAGFIVTLNKATGHYGVRPPTQELLEQWAATKEPLKRNETLPHPLTKLAQTAIRGTGNLKR